MTVKGLACGLILLLSIGLYGCGGSHELTKRSSDDNLSVNPADDTKSAVTELVALADTQEEAERIGELYGIELSSYSYGTAVYVTDKDPLQLMELGRDNDYPALTLNGESYLHSNCSEPSSSQLQ